MFISREITDAVFKAPEGEPLVAFVPAEGGVCLCCNKASLALLLTAMMEGMEHLRGNPAEEAQDLLHQLMPFVRDMAAQLGVQVVEAEEAS